MSEFSERNKTIAELVGNGATLQSVGDLYGISKERVRQIAGTLGVSARTCQISGSKRYCKKCGADISDRSRGALYCLKCSPWYADRPEKCSICGRGDVLSRPILPHKGYHPSCKANLRSSRPCVVCGAPCHGQKKEARCVKHKIREVKGRMK